MKSLAPNIALSDPLRPVSRAAADYDTTGVDLTNIHGRLDFLVSAGTFGSSATLNGKLQESDDDSTYTDVSGNDSDGVAPTITQLDAAGSARVSRNVRSFTKRYARLRCTVATAAVVFGVTQASFPNQANA